MTLGRDGAGRRGLLRALAAGAFGAFGAAATREAASATKTTKALAQYQDRPKGIASCATCTQFVAPDGCKTVAGKVSADGWCNLYDMVD